MISARRRGLPNGRVLIRETSRRLAGFAYKPQSKRPFCNRVRSAEAEMRPGNAGGRTNRARCGDGREGRGTEIARRSGALTPPATVADARLPARERPTPISLAPCPDPARRTTGTLGACAAGSWEPVPPGFMEGNILFSVNFRTWECPEMRNRGGKSYLGQCAGMRVCFTAAIFSAAQAPGAGPSFRGPAATAHDIREA